MEIKMLSQTLRILFASALFIHGIGHIHGFWMPTSSRLIPNISKPLARVISSIFWILSAVGFVSVMIGYLGVFIPSDWWQSLSIVAACISLFGLILFGKNWSRFNLIGAFTMNLSIITVVLCLVVI
jgi:uncharacterized membrane protein YphA (DoxX/SURF4 family)